MEFKHFVTILGLVGLVVNKIYALPGPLQIALKFDSSVKTAASSIENNKTLDQDLEPTGS